MHLTLTHPLERPPTFAELQALAKQHEVQIHGDDSAGDFCHPNLQQPKVTGRYAFEPNGDIRGDFTGNFMGKLAGSFVLATGKAEITIIQKPLFLPEPLLKSNLEAGLKKFCAVFSSLA
jgi:hypothetical protein